MVDKKLTDVTIPTLADLDLADLIHVVDVSDTTDDPAGSSKKIAGVDLNKVSVVDNAGASITLNSTNVNKLIRTTSATAVTVTVPTFAAGSNAQGYTWAVFQKGAGQVSFVTSGGSVINSESGNLKIANQYNSVVVTASPTTDEYDLIGKLTA
jgi:hypothetical protein